MATLSVRMDDTLKQQTEVILEELGLNISTAVTMFAKAIVREKRLPLNLSVEPFYSAANQAVLTRAIAEYEAQRAKTVVKTFDDLEALEDDG